MVRRIIIWKLKDDCDKEKVKADMKEHLESLEGAIDGLLVMRVHTKGVFDSMGDAMLEAHFLDEKYAEAYVPNPLHQQIANTYVRPFVKERIVFNNLE